LIASWLHCSPKSSPNTMEILAGIIGILAHQISI
jgi:hypothetical protein